MRSLIILAAALFAVPASAEPSIFGIEIGRPLPFAECQPATDPRRFYRGNPRAGASFPYANSTDAPCFERTVPHALSAAPVRDEWIEVAYPPNPWPEISKRNKISVRVIDGAVERIVFSTAGARTQNLDLAALRTRFGEPSSTATQVVQNAYGAAFNQIAVIWQLGDVSVTFLSPSTVIDNGVVTLTSSKGESWYRQWSRERYGGSTPL